MSNEEIRKLKEDIRKLQINEAEKEKRIKRLEEIVDVQQLTLLDIRKQMIRPDRPSEN